VRQQIVKARLAFDTDSLAFRERHAREQAALAQRIHDARAQLASLDFDDAVHARVSELCIAAQVDGLRADLVMLRAARALAAFDGARAIGVEHVESIAEAVLKHRRREGERPQQPQSQAHANPQANDADWGYLPPEPAETATVKNVRPLQPKKV
jgi:magnesium chelatase subunit I